jgi:hypothetical protein
MRTGVSGALSREARPPSSVPPGAGAGQVAGGTHDAEERIGEAEVTRDLRDRVQQVVCPARGPGNH